MREQSPDIWVLPESGKARPFLATPADEASPVFSPDGRWLAFTSDHSGNQEVYVKHYPGEAGMEQVSRDDGREPVWARNELFYRSGNRMVAVPVSTKQDLQLGTPPHRAVDNSAQDLPHHLSSLLGEPY